MRIWKLEAKIETDDDINEDKLLDHIAYGINTGEGIYLEVKTIRCTTRIKDQEERECISQK